MYALNLRSRRVFCFVCLFVLFYFIIFRCYLIGLTRVRKLTKMNEPYKFRPAHSTHRLYAAVSVSIYFFYRIQTTSWRSEVGTVLLIQSKKLDTLVYTPGYPWPQPCPHDVIPTAWKAPQESCIMKGPPESP